MSPNDTYSYVCTESSLRNGCSPSLPLGVPLAVGIATLLRQSHRSFMLDYTAALCQQLRALVTIAR